MFSCKTSFKDGSTLPFVQYLVSLALLRAVRTVEGFEDVDVNIKWPNDIYVNGNTKLGGILCQSSYMAGSFDVTIGN